MRFTILEYSLFLVIIFLITLLIIKYFSLKKLKAEQKELKRKSNILRQYNKATKSSNIISNSDLKGNITYVNDTFCEVSQYKREEIIGRPHNILRGEEDLYIQEVSDLVEWANGPATSKWGSIRAAAGHPEPFNLKYIGVGNEDKMTPEFEERFAMIYKAVKTKHPEIEIVGSSGPFYEGEDFEKGWEIAKALDVDVIDEHYYVNPDWFIKNTKRYDSYDRKGSKVYLGEYASWGNKLRNAIAEASFMTGLERNGDIVELTSYAPLFAKKGNTQWRTDMIFFDNSTAILTPNYHVQKMFSANSGDFYLSNIISSNLKDTTLTYSAVTDAETGDLILKFVNTGDVTGNFNVNLSTIKGWQMEATNTVITGDPEAENSFEHPENIKPTSSTFSVKKNFIYEAPASSLSVIRIKVKSKS